MSARPLARAAAWQLPLLPSARHDLARRAPRAARAAVASAAPRDAPASRWRHVPNALSLSRIGFIPFICALWLSSNPLRAQYCALLFGIATVTDGLDGYLARRLNATSRFGAFLDPVTDKLLVCACLTLLASTLGSVAFTACAILAVGREIAVSALREWMASCGRRDDVQVGFLGKCKTASQLVAIWLFFALPASPAAAAWAAPLRLAAHGLLVASTGLSLVSMGNYFAAARSSLFG
jgi:CDP-diacylglycerol--glycerol-3-phosphate 3-phosphatidyltransferase